MEQFLSTPADATAIVGTICDALGIKPPRVRLMMNSRGGRYMAGKKPHFTVGMKSTDLSPIDVLLHELAHHVEFTRNGGRRAEKGRSHGPSFVTALGDVVHAFRGDRTQYAWHADYKTVYKLAIERGWAIRSAP